MKVWEYIINSAMLGLEKPAPGKPDLPEGLNDVFGQINDSTNLDRESKFLQQAAIVYNYRKSGFQPIQKNDVQVSMAEIEILSYTGLAATLALRKVLNEGNLSLLTLWMERCSTNNQLVLAELLPEVLDQAANHNTLRQLAVICSGNKGKWLSQFNPDWNYFVPERSEEEIWLTGKPEERTTLLKSIRMTDPSLAREMVIETWPQEHAAQKLDFLKVLHQNKQPADLQWLEGLRNEKGKVKDGILNLLRQIPNSAIIQKYEALLSEAFTLKKEKALLGMVTKTVLQFKFPEVVDEDVYKSGIEKLARGNSGFTDEEYIAYQLIQYVPPGFWEKQLSASPEEVVAYFMKYAEKFVGSLAIAVSIFYQKNWIPHFLVHNTLYVDFLEVIVPLEQEKYLSRFLNSLPLDVVEYALKMNQVWSLGFAKSVMKVMSNDPYRFNLGVYRNKIGLIPTQLTDELENLGPEKVELISAWGNIKNELKTLLLLKEEVIQAFTNK